MMRVLRLAAAGIAVLLLTVHLAPWHSLRLPLHYNITPSLPRGLYRAEWRTAVLRGDLLRICIPAPIASSARARGYLGAGPCPGGAAPVGKMVVGLPGDTVAVGRALIRIGTKVSIAASLRARDSRGRPVEGAAGVHVLTENECFVLSTFSRHSYDSRYFGPVPCAPPHLVLTPVSATVRSMLIPLRRALTDVE